VEPRKIVYITNQIESINFQLCKITKNRGHFDNNDAAMKLVYLGLRNISSERGGFSGTGTRNWTVAPNTLAAHFPGRIPLC
jgi:putative transposase